MIDKDGYLQGMQGIKMTNEAIHDRMKTLKDSVVKSEDSVKRLVAEIKMLGQRVFQSHKAVQKEEEPELPMVSPTEQLPERPPEDLNLEETWEDDVTSDRDNKLESQAPVADSDPFFSLIMDMKASIPSPSKVLSNSEQIRKGLPDDDLLKAEEDRGIRNRTKVEEELESDSIQLVLLVSNFQDHKLFEPPMLQLLKRYMYIYYIYIFKLFYFLFCMTMCVNIEALRICSFFPLK
ncbi:uncharacterized protein [Apostichopus japonicus]